MSRGNRQKTTDESADIEALTILSSQIQIIGNLDEPPNDLKDIDAYKKSLDKTLQTAATNLQIVKDYVINVDSKVKKLNDCLKDYIDKVKDAIERCLSNIIPEERVKYVVNPKQTQNVFNLKLALELQQIAKDIINSRLNELITETENCLAIAKSDSCLTENNITYLKGCLNSFKNAKNESYKVEQKRLEEEEVARKMREIAKRQQEAEEKAKLEEEERRKEIERQAQLEFERKQKEEEENRRKEEERKRAEEEKKRREEDERKKKEEEEFKKKQEEEDRKQRQQEDEKRRKAQEDAKRREEERLRRVAEEKAKLLDPANWRPIIYKEEDQNENVICCITAPQGAIEKEDIECTDSDELNSVITILQPGEKLACRPVQLSSKKGNLNFEVPIRAYIPLIAEPENSEEIVIKVSINGSDWRTTNTVKPTSNIMQEDHKFIGVELNDFDTASIFVVTRPRGEVIVVDEAGTKVSSKTNKNFDLFVPRNAFTKRTEIIFLVQEITDEKLSLIKQGNENISRMISTSPIVTLLSQTPPTKGIEIDFRRTTKSDYSKVPKGILHQFYKTGNSDWKNAEIEYKNTNNDISYSLPALKEKYRLVELELPSNITKESALEIANALENEIDSTSVQLIVRQQESQPDHIIVQCVCQRNVAKRLAQLHADGFTKGPDISRPFALQDGDELLLTFSGNIDAATGSSETIKMMFFKYLDTAKQEIYLTVRDTYKQRDLPEYRGLMICFIQSCREQCKMQSKQPLEMVITLPKIEKPECKIKVAKVRFPYYLSALSTFLSWKLSEMKNDNYWKEVLKALFGNDEFKKKYRNAQRKNLDTDTKAMCKTMLTDWMRSTCIEEDKIQPIIKSLNECRLQDLANQCLEMLNYYKENLPDSVLNNMVSNTKGGAEEIGQKLNLSDVDIKQVLREYPDNRQAQTFEMIRIWCQSENALQLGKNVLENLIKLLE